MEEKVELITNYNTRFIVVLFIYISLSFISSLISNWQKDPKERRYWLEFFLSFVALLLMPLILKVMGNNSLNEFIENDFSYERFLELIGYSCAISLAGRKAISIVLNSLNLGDVKREVDGIKKQQNSLEKSQEDLIEREASEDLKSIPDDEYLSFLVRIMNNNILPASIKDEEKSYLDHAKLKNHINVFGDKNKIRLTSIGKRIINRNR